MVKKMKVLNDVLGYDLKIFQDDNYFKFSLDSVILANLVNIKHTTKKILDLGTGNGIIPIILTRRTNSLIDAVEIQKDLANLAQESIKYNNLENQIYIYNVDMIDFSKNKNELYDLITCNPPYFKSETKSTKNIDIHKAIARHEIKINLEKIIKISGKMLKNKGILGMICRVDRFVEVIELFKKYNIEPKNIKFIYNNTKSAPDLFLIQGMKNGNNGLLIDKPFILHDEQGNKTNDYLEIMGGKYDSKKL